MIDPATIELLKDPAVQITATIMGTLLGAVVGSYLNVVIYRLPRGMSTTNPKRSACPTCGHQIKGYDNIPVLSYILLGGRCRSCKEPFSASYALVEGFTAILFGTITYLFWPQFVIVPLLIAAAYGIAIFGIDATTYKMPRNLTRPLWLILPPLITAAAFIDSPSEAGETLTRSALSALMWLAIFGIPWLLYPGKMGFGDVLLSAPLGLLLGYFSWSVSVTGFFAAFGIGTVVMLIVMAAGKAGRKTAVPFGPFMLAGALYGILTQGALWEAYLRVVGF